MISLNIFEYLRRGTLSLILMIIVIITFNVKTVYAARKLVFTVGINIYNNLPNEKQLANSANDARAVGDQFELLGYEVTFGENSTRSQFYALWQSFLDGIGDGDTVALFLSGHGVEIEGENLLLPRDIPYVQYGQQEIYKNQSINIAQLLLSVRNRHPRVIILIIDACRDNPFIPPEYKSVVTGVGALAKIEPAGGEFIMYSAAAGQTALDRLPGEDRADHSIYVRNLLPLMLEANLTLQELAQMLRQQVYRQAQSAFHQQSPAYYDGLMDKFCLVRCGEAFEGASPPSAGGNTQANPATAEAEPAPGQYQAGDKFRDCDDCPPMVVVPAGSFTMGSPQSEEGRDVGEGPQHDDAIAKPFAMGQYEVTFDEWADCVKGGGCGDFRPGDQDWGRGRRPMIDVSWADATAYVAWLSQETGQPYRLPSEAEWEYAARAKTTTRYWWGNGITSENANYGDNVGRTTEGGTYPANPWGLYDMQGNVWEWVEDCYHASYEGAPKDGSAWTSADCGVRVLRGGSWGKKPEFLRSASRYWYFPADRSYDTGFRVARTLR